MALCFLNEAEKWPIGCRSLDKLRVGFVDFAERGILSWLERVASHESKAIYGLMGKRGDLGLVYSLELIEDTRS